MATQEHSDTTHHDGHDHDHSHHNHSGWKAYLPKDDMVFGDWVIG